MAKKFVRNITDTNLKGKNKEPLHTNLQNDLLSDKTDVYVRNQDEYHCLTDNVKSITSSDTDRLKVKTTGKNSRELQPSQDLILKNQLDKAIKDSEENLTKLINQQSNNELKPTNIIPDDINSRNFQLINLIKYGNLYYIEIGFHPEVLESPVNVFTVTDKINAYIGRYSLNTFNNNHPTEKIDAKIEYAYTGLKLTVNVHDDILKYDDLIFVNGFFLGSEVMS